MKKVIVTGATGFIGGALTRKMLDMGTEVYGIGTNPLKFQSFVADDKFHPVVADFEKYGSLVDMIPDRDIDVFFHFAWAGGFTSAVRDYSLQMRNAAYAGDALIAAKKLGCKKFVYAGTYNEYEIQTFLGSESFEPRYTCIYSTGKTAADLVCSTLAFNLGMEYCAGLVPMPYGEGNYSKQLVNVVITSLLHGISPKLVEGNNIYDLVYIEDIVRAFVAIGGKGENQKKYYIGHRHLKSFREWMLDIKNILAPEIDLKFGEYKDSQNIDYSLIDLDSLYRDTGFECSADFRSTLLKTAAWVKDNIAFDTCKKVY